MTTNRQVLNYELEEFFNRTNDQIIRITSNQGSNSIVHDHQLERSPKLTGEKVTLADVCSVASHVADKMNLSKVKQIDLQEIRGFRLPSSTVDREGESEKTSSIRRSPIRLCDILPKDDHSQQRSFSSISTLSKSSTIHSSAEHQKTKFN